MLSSPSRNLQARQRATHRRQNSTPSAFEAAKIPALPNNVQQQRQRALGHRRGLSLDTRRQTMSPAMTTTTTTPTGQGFAKVSNNTNTGLATTTPQHMLRGAQQQRIPARPGLEHQNNQQQQLRRLHHQQQQNFMSAAADNESYLMSPHATPQHQRYDQTCYDAPAVPFNPYNGGMNVMMPMAKDHTGFAGGMITERDFELFGPDSDLSTPSFLNYAESPNSAQGWQSEEDASSSRRSSRRISNGIMDRVSKFENMGMEPAQRPSTPPRQNANNYFPPTPGETPQDRMSKQESSAVSRPNRFAEGYDESMEETLKPVRNSSSRRTQTIFEEMRRRAENDDAVHTPPQTSQFPESQVFDSQVPPADFVNMNNFNAEFMRIRTPGLDDLPDDSPVLSQHSTPHTPLMNFHHSAFEGKPDLRPADGSVSSPFTPSHHSLAPSSRRASPHNHRRTESLASVTSAASIASINIEETKTETGITMDDIAHHIQGPDPSDNKWVCVFEDCGKRFGRKENIKSHVQTHLNDRQYQCPSCNKCFVRQHDLKRHAKIHTGIKPYPCECGNSFARHDALTRHRQRGMCIGAFDGIVKKVVKRGRPRKHRPEMDERVNKSALTRQRNKSSASSASSQSGYSDASAANSPEADAETDFHHFSDGGAGDFVTDLLPVKMEPSNRDCSAAPMPTTMTQQFASISSAPMPSFRPRASHSPPELAPSPSAASVASSSHHSVSAASPYVSPEAIMEMTQSLPPPPPQQAHSPAKSESVASQYNTPPELSQSSSPPPDPNRYFDASEPHSSSAFGDESLLAGPIGNTSFSGLGLGDQDDLMKAFTNDDALSGFDRSFMGKFDEFDDAVDMFTNGDDMFFGTS